MLLRFHAPKGGYFNDTARTAGILTTIATLFSVLFALVILLSVEAYKDTQSKADAEADSVLNEFQLATLFHARDRYAIQSQLVCYGQSVSALEWPVVNDHRTSPVVEQWGSSVDSTAGAAEVEGTRAAASYQLFVGQSLERQQDRRGRLEGAAGALPAMVWPVLILGAASILVFVVGHADRAEPVFAQMFQVGVAVVLVCSSLFLINALNHPFVAKPGRIEPVEMDRAVSRMKTDLARSIDADSLDATLPCDAQGRPLQREPATPNFASTSTMGRSSLAGSWLLVLVTTSPSGVK